MAGRRNVVNTITEIETFPDGKQRVRTIDRDTGEVISEAWRVWRKSPGGKRPPDKAGQPPFVRVWMPNLIQIVRQKQLTNAEAGLLFKLLAFLDWQGTMLVHPETGRAVNTNEIARYLGIGADHLSRQLDELVKKGLLGKFISGTGKPYRYHFNCNLAFFGKKMNDPRDWERFNRDCSFEPVVRVDYKEETDEKKMTRKDF